MKFIVFYYIAQNEVSSYSKIFYFCGYGDGTLVTVWKFLERVFLLCLRKVSVSAIKCLQVFLLLLCKKNFSEKGEFGSLWKFPSSPHRKANFNTKVQISFQRWDTKEWNQKKIHSLLYIACEDEGFWALLRGTV